MITYNVGAPLERVALDVLGPLPTTERGNKYILVIADYFTKWTESYSIPDQEAVTVATKLVEEFVSRFGVPRNYTRKRIGTLSPLYSLKFALR